MYTKRNLMFMCESFDDFSQNFVHSTRKAWGTQLWKNYYNNNNNNNNNNYWKILTGTWPLATVILALFPYKITYKIAENNKSLCIFTDNRVWTLVFSWTWLMFIWHMFWWKFHVSTIYRSWDKVGVVFSHVITW